MITTESTNIGTGGWKIHEKIIESSFNWGWRPPRGDLPYIYVWGNKWVRGEEKPTVEYYVPGATQKKYMRTLVELAPEEDRWVVHEKVKEFDYSWRPNPYSPPYIYVWGNKWIKGEVKATLEYRTPGATQYCYMPDPVELEQDNPSEPGSRWKILIPGARIDFSWRPNPYSPPYIYVWGNKWNDAATEPTITYTVPGAVDYKYIEDVVAELPATSDYWTTANGSVWADFDYSWRPNPYSPPQIYQWGGGGPIYKTPGATNVVYLPPGDKKSVSIPKYYIETNLEDLIKEHIGEVFWALNPDLNYDGFNFNWQPNKLNFQHINVFGNASSIDTQTYYINGPMWGMGYHDYNYIKDIDGIIDTNLSMFWVDTGFGSHEQYERLKEKYPKLQATRFFNSWIETIGRCGKKSETKLFWVLSSEIDYSGFDFDFYPSEWQQDMLHIFGHQWSEWGNTYFVNRDVFQHETKFVNNIEHIKGVNHVPHKKTKINVCKYDVLHIDLGGGDNTKPLEALTRTVHKVKYVDSYLNTIKSWIQNNPGEISAKYPYMWITTSICDYSGFDFSWQVNPFQAKQINVFSSRWGETKQQFGDTFFLDMNEFRKHMGDITSLEDYVGKVNYIEDISVPRRQHPVIKHCEDSQIFAIDKLYLHDFPYGEIVDIENLLIPGNLEPPVLWVQAEQNIIICSDGGTQLVVPSAAAHVIHENELYVYPKIHKLDILGKTKPLDIIFISNGEPAAEENWNWLNERVEAAGTKNRLVWIKDVGGRVASQHAAAKKSTTNWYFLVNGKLRVSTTFDWAWQPDRLQKPKHYIFSATNPVNGLKYGHQAIVANNRYLTLNTEVSGLDFTMASLHQVVDMDSGVALYNTDPWTTWRTAFRESIKLSANSDPDSKKRLAAWLVKGSGDYAEWSQRGATDGVEYYNTVDGKLEDLMNSYDWAWIHKYYVSKYGG